MAKSLSLQASFLSFAHFTLVAQFWVICDKQMRNPLKDTTPLKLLTQQNLSEWFTQTTKDQEVVIGSWNSTDGIAKDGKKDARTEMLFREL